MRKFSLVLILAAAFGCNNPPTYSPVLSDSLKEIMYQDMATRAQRQRPGLDSIARIRFPEFTCNIAGYVADTADKHWFSFGKDTVGLNTTEPGYMPLGNYATVQSEELTGIRMDFRYTTVSCIYGWNGLLSLYDWQHWTSEWEPLPAANDSFYIRQLSDAEKKKFGEVDLDAWKTWVRVHLSLTYYESVKNLKSVNDFPAMVTLDQMWFRVSGKRKSDGADVSKVIVLQAPLQ